MKHDLNNLDLRGAFREEPETCHRALMNAASSVREEKKGMTRNSMKTMLIAALVVVSMVTTAFAAGKIFGWTEFAGDMAHVPQEAVNQMQVREQRAWQVGPLTMTLTEMLCDGHIALTSVHISPADGSSVLLCVDPCDIVGANGENGREHAARLGVDPKMTWVEVAQKLDRPLYSVRGILDGPYNGMEDPLWNEDGSVTYCSMIFLDEAATPFDKTNTELDAGLYLRAAQIDPATGEEMEKWIDREQCVTIPVQGMLEEKSYQPREEVVIAGMKLERITAQRYVTGAYVDCVFTAGEGVTEEDSYKLYETTLRDVHGNELPGGVNLSTSVDVSAWPTVVLHDLVGVETLPESMYLSYNAYVTSK